MRTIPEQSGDVKEVAYFRCGEVGTCWRFSIIFQGNAGGEDGSFEFLPPA